MRLIIGNKNFTESRVLACLIAGTLARTPGLQTEVREFATTLACYQALEQGTIDLYPEYTGTLVAYLWNQAYPVDPRALLEQALLLASSHTRLELLEPFNFTDNLVLALHENLARSHRIHTLSRLAQFGGLVGGVTRELKLRPEFAGLVQAYDLTVKWEEFECRRELHQAMSRESLDLVATTSNEPLLGSLRCVRLEDDRSDMPVYQVVPLVRREILTRFPEVRTALNALSSKIDAEVLKDLSASVDLEGVEAARATESLLERLALDPLTDTALF